MRMTPLAVDVLSGEHCDDERQIENIHEHGPSRERGEEEEQRRAEQLGGEEAAPSERDAAGVENNRRRQDATNIASKDRDDGLAPWHE